MINKAKYSISVENQKGTSKLFVDDDEISTYPLKSVIYPVDYGSIKGYIGEDGDDLDIFIGSGELAGYIKVWRLDVPEEVKFFIQVTPKEVEEIKAAFKPVLLACEVLSDESFEEKIEKYKKNSQ
ncbi:MAG TPA: hypothetical protein PK950_03200 [Candidatus Paceibacterota bacterium]|nr:hypothetical protein [Candidatus Paceibacterota bacterium]